MKETKIIEAHMNERNNAAIALIEAITAVFGETLKTLDQIHGGCVFSSSIENYQPSTLICEIKVYSDQSVAYLKRIKASIGDQVCDLVFKRPFVNMGEPEQKWLPEIDMSGAFPHLQKDGEFSIPTGSYALNIRRDTWTFNLALSSEKEKEYGTAGCFKVTVTEPRPVANFAGFIPHEQPPEQN